MELRVKGIDLVLEARDCRLDVAVCREYLLAVYAEMSHAREPTTRGGTPARTTKSCG